MPAVTDYSAAGGWRGTTGGWSVDLGASFGHNHVDYDLRNTLNTSLGPCLDLSTCPAAYRPPVGIPNQTSFNAGRLLREEFIAAANVTTPLNLGLPAPIHLAGGAAFRRGRYGIVPGELASYVNGGETPPLRGSPVPGPPRVPGLPPLHSSPPPPRSAPACPGAET